MRLIDLLYTGSKELRSSGIEESDLDSRILLEHCTGKTRTEIFLEGNDLVSSPVMAHFFNLIHRRQQREPLAYILGEQEFWSLPFVVSPNVLIPRPETEFLLERTLALTVPANIEHGRILDLCCGSGVIGIVLALETGKRVTVADISAKALEVCRANVTKHSVERKIEIIQSDLFEKFYGTRLFSLIVSNPPYVDSFELENTLAPEVSNNEPRLALNGGSNGMEIIVKIRKELPAVLQKGGQFFMEIGADQGEAVLDLFLHASIDSLPFSKAEILTDYSGHDRVLVAQL